MTNLVTAWWLTAWLIDYLDVSWSLYNKIKVGEKPIVCKSKPRVGRSMFVSILWWPPSPAVVKPEPDLEFSTTYSHQLGSLGSARRAFYHTMHIENSFFRTTVRRAAHAAASTHSSNWPSLCLGSFNNYVDIISKFCQFLTSYLHSCEHFSPWTSTVIGIFWAPTYPPHLVHVVLERPTWHMDGLAIIFLFKNNLVMM